MPVTPLSDSHSFIIVLPNMLRFLSSRQRPIKIHGKVWAFNRCFLSSITDTENETSTPPVDNDACQKPATSSLLSEIIRQQRRVTESISINYPLPTGVVPEMAQPSQTPKVSNNANTHAPSDIASTKTDLDFFEVFKVPDPMPNTPKRPRGPNSFTESSCEQYRSLLEPAIESGDLIRTRSKRRISVEDAHQVYEWLRSEETVIPHDLPTFREALKRGLDSLGSISGIDPSDRSHTNEVFAQNAMFQEKMGFSALQMDLVRKSLFLFANNCAKLGKGLAVEVLWEKVKEAGYAERRMLHALLYVSGTFSGRSYRSRLKRRSKYGHLTGATSILDVLDEESDKVDSIENQEDFVDMTDEIAIFHDLMYQPTEQSINVRVKLFVAQGKAKEAEQLLDAHVTGENALRLRGYSPVLRLYLELGNLSSALKLFKKMKSIATVHLDAETYVHLIAGLAEHGAFRSSAEKVEGSEELGYTHSSGPGFLDELLSDMASEFFEIPEAAATKLYMALAKGFPESNLDHTESLAPLRLNKQKADEDELIASLVSINAKTGICPRTEVKLRLILLDATEKETLVTGVTSIAKQQFGDFLKVNTRLRYNQNRQVKTGEEHLLEFCRFLDQRHGKPFTAVCDGANIGYYSQNFEDGKFSYHQIKFMVDSLERMGENPLVIIPYKYTKDAFHIMTRSGGGRQFRKQKLTISEMAIRNDLLHRGKIVCVPPGMLGKMYTNSMCLFRRLSH